MCVSETLSLYPLRVWHRQAINRHTSADVCHESKSPIVSPTSCLIDCPFTRFFCSTMSPALLTHEDMAGK